MKQYLLSVIQPDGRRRRPRSWSGSTVTSTP